MWTIATSTMVTFGSQVKRWIAIENSMVYGALYGLGVSFLAFHHTSCNLWWWFSFSLHFGVVSTHGVNLRKIFIVCFLPFFTKCHSKQKTYLVFLLFIHECKKNMQKNCLALENGTWKILILIYFDTFGRYKQFFFENKKKK